MLYKRGKTWWVDFGTPAGRIRCSAGTGDKRLAQEYHDRLKAEAWQRERLGTKPDRTLEEAFLRWLQERQAKKSLRFDAVRIKRMGEWRSKKLSEVTRESFRAFTDTLSSPGSANRYVALMSSILHAAERQWDWIVKAPALYRYPEPPGRDRWLSVNEWRKLEAELPPHLKGPATFAIATGLRLGNILGLKWEQVDLPARRLIIRSDEMKSGRALGIPLNETAQSVLEALRRAPIVSATWVFTYKGKRLQSYGKAWDKAVLRTGMGKCRFHDLRRTFATWLSQAGVPREIVKRLGGWTSGEVIDRYAHYNVESLRPWAVVIDRILGHGTFTAQPLDLCVTNLLKINGP